VSSAKLRPVVALAAFALGVFLTATASAHKPSDSYLTLAVRGPHIEGRWDVALRDLDNVMGLDRDGKGDITWGEVRTRAPEIASFALDRLTLAADDAPCPVRFGDLRIADHSDGSYAVIRFEALCSATPRMLDVDYQLFFDVDPQHRGVTRIDDDAATRAAIFTDAERHQRFPLAHAERSRQLGAAIRLGIAHIFSGIDHLLFLIALLLPSVLSRNGARGTWEPVLHLRAALLDVLRIVTAFTLAHSITLSLATFGVVRPPSRFIEAGIAASVVLAAMNNVFPILEESRWGAAFLLGLLHGFGFSATLLDLDLPRQNLVVTLFGFNVGVELGQLCVVLAFVPLAYAVRSTDAYRRVAMQGGSLAIAAVAGVWFVERAFAWRMF